MTKPKITVVGSYAVGMTMSTAKFPVSGETVIGHNFKVLHGGKGSNQAVAIARLGGDVSFVACLGDDYYGRNALELYTQEKVDASFVRLVKDSYTGVGFIIVNNDGQNIIVLDPGANNMLTSEDVERAEEIIASSAAVLMQLEISPGIVAYTAQLARQYGVQVVLNPAPYQPLPDEVLPRIDILIPNETEARLLAGLPSDDDSPIEEVGMAILAKGVGKVIITLGAEGALLVTGEEIYHIPGKEVDVVDTTGAGDTFSAALTMAVAEGKDIKKAMDFAVRAAALAVTKYGVIPALPYRHEVEAI
ncbi:ribokinase [Neomoorella thermoacetica]|uniref:ribokinase n=1 Tax=Neomoorella thermoacetica TaxID=1525 RepID=UPI0008FB9D1F|nr:ribokinase [Moorella thermoacetica]APC09281.1 ribokinase [Moorella thermoacetica]OIQ62630.1 ribokinase [Moorella thermoacetica]